MTWPSVITLDPSLTLSPGRTIASWLGLILAVEVGDVGDTLPAVAEADLDDIHQTLDGDGEAYRRIVERYQQEIAKRLRRFSRDPQMIEELVQEVFVQAYFSLDRFRASAPLIHWLHRIAVRVGYRYWKTRTKRDVSLGDHDLAAPATAGPNTEALDRVLAKLSPRDRLVVTLLYLEEHSVEETARLTGWSKSMVKVQAFRARGKLRKLAQKENLGGRS